jgi:hypothetical protein
MTYLYLVAPQELGPHFRIGSMSATLPSSAQVAGFCKAALEALGHPSPSLLQRPDLTLLEGFVRNIVANKNVPILCIDEFERLMDYPECNSQFFNELRAITQIGLGLVVLSKKPLAEIMSENGLNSNFYNVFQPVSLVPFDKGDAEQFLQEKGTQAHFTIEERRYIQTYSRTDGEKFPPLRLQLVGDRLWHEKYVTDPATRQRYRPDDPAYWEGFKERVDATYRGMVIHEKG